MIEDTFESLEDDDMEEAAQEEVDKILFEITSGMSLSFDCPLFCHIRYLLSY